ncbi:hypothetical protein [Pseudomonas sp. NPDC007930]|uniref:hypothetical protein n=1 Tax=Pseudomonas sp. NPDC007930 TaxID=3364417 RepID=UPI0036E7F3F0
MKANTAAPPHHLRCIEAAVIQAAEANDGLAMLLTLLDAAHDQTASLEQVRCLLEPLQRKLAVALEQLEGWR